MQRSMLSAFCAFCGCAKDLQRLWVTIAIVAILCGPPEHSLVAHYYFASGQIIRPHSLWSLLQSSNVNGISEYTHLSNSLSPATTSATDQAGVHVATSARAAEESEVVQGLEKHGREENWDDV